MAENERIGKEKDSSGQLPWTRKYQPKKSSEILGQESQVKAVKKFIENFRNEKKKALLLYGPSGTGKTSLVHAIARENKIEILEVNASDFRGSEQIQSTIGNASKQASLFARDKILLIDEVDGISGQNDRGGMPTLAKIISETSFPVIMTAGFKEDPREIHWDSKYSTLKTKSTLVRFDKVGSEHIFALLKKIAGLENLKVEDEILKRIARHSGGDARAALTDFETFADECVGKKGNVSLEEAKCFLETLGGRKLVESMPSALIKIFRSMNFEIASSAFDSVDEDIDSQVMWIDENLPKEYRNADELNRAYEMLSKADMFKGRIKKRQYWGFLRTIGILISSGIAVSKDKKPEHSASYKQPERLLDFWKANMKYQKRKAIAKKFAKKSHSSEREATYSIPYLKIIFHKDRKMADKIAKSLELDEEEIDWLKR
ncbi:MAG: replication factor C large subunit [Candidatus Woesearchaeota archaeon]|nr:replication factor C large subunit [Candidatus Woesearchaeota archaeon]